MGYYKPCRCWVTNFEAIVSDIRGITGQAAIDHVVRLLQMNPIHQGMEIIDARREALGLAEQAKPTQSPRAEDVRALRRKVVDQLKSIRSQFWAMPIDQLNKQLNALDNQGFVDLEASIARVRVVATYRDRFPALSEKPGFDGDLFSVLKDVLVRSPRDTAVIREQVLSSFRSRARRKRGRRMVALLKTKMPAIYELEADWFDTLYRQKAQPRVTLLTSKSARTGTRPVGSKSNVGSYGWMIWIAIVAISGLIRSASNDRQSTRSYTPSMPDVSNYQFKPIPQIVPGEGMSPKFENSKGEILLGRAKDGSEIYSTPHGLLLVPGSKSPDSFGSQEPFVLPKVPDPLDPSKNSDDRYSR
jgi:hypothetical protein